jgi:hypothetical protein
MPNYQGVWSLSTQFQNAGAWPVQPLYGDIGIVAGDAGGNGAVIDYIQISTLGNAQDFGDITGGTYTAGYYMGGCSSSTRGLFMGGAYHGEGAASSNFISVITIASRGNSSKFGDLTQGRSRSAGVSNDTRGLNGGGSIGSDNPQTTIDYVTIASDGNAIDFGDLTVARSPTENSFSSTTRGVFGGGRTSGTDVNTIDYVTIASTGNATDFGDQSTVGSGGGCSNGTRGVFAGGYSGGRTNIMEYVTIATTGNTSDFGDLTAASFLLSGTSNKTRGLFMGSVGTGDTTAIDYITIATTGNAADFGDMTIDRGGSTSFSNAHGGLS